MWLEDLYVAPEARGRRAGAALMAGLVRRVVEKRCSRLE